MNEWGVVFMGVMAASLAIMASIQVGLIMVGIRVARQMTAATEELRREVRPLVEKAHRIADEAARATSLATQQVERLDRFMATTTDRIDDTLSTVQGIMAGPVRQASTAVTAFRAVMSIVREWNSRRPRDARRHAREDDDALFVG